MFFSELKNNHQQEKSQMTENFLAVENILKVRESPEDQTNTVPPTGKKKEQHQQLKTLKDLKIFSHLQSFLIEKKKH